MSGFAGVILAIKRRCAKKDKDPTIFNQTAVKFVEQMADDEKNITLNLYKTISTNNSGNVTISPFKSAISPYKSALIFPANCEDIQNFPVNLYKTISANNAGNVAISPFSADAALSMAYGGARGATQSEMASAMNINQDHTIAQISTKFKSVNAASASYTLQSANGLFLEKTYDILPTYRIAITCDFGANITSVDFINQPDAAGRQMNTFVKAKTNNKIQDLFSAGSITDDTRLVLVNAVYFKADWEKEFNSDATSNQPFTIANGQQKSVPLMNQQTSFLYTESVDLGGAQVLELKYKQGEASMVVILPKQESGLGSLEKSLTATALNAALRQLSQHEVNVFLPKFKVNTGYELVPQLQALGIITAFTDDADFSGISTRKDLKISNVVQKVFVEVDEKGTEATAATYVHGDGDMAIAVFDLPVFRADRPFLYLIRHTATNSILFMGRVSDPTVAN